MKAAVLLTLGCLLLTGCVRTFMAVKNSTDQNITVISSHTGKAVIVHPGQTRNVPHSHGSLTITSDSGSTWTKDNISALGGQRQRDFIFWTKVVQTFEVTE